MKHLIVTYGAKQSGKTTSLTAFYGYHLTSLGVIPNANIDPNGRMSVIYNKKTNEGIYFDVDDVSPEILIFKRNNIWAHIKHVSFADALKEAIITLFGVKREHIYGSDLDKCRPTRIKWDSVWKFLSDDRRLNIIKTKMGSFEYLTIRELCQVFGTDICRELYQNCHLRSAVDKLAIDGTNIGYIADGRFDNEFFYFDTDEAKELLGNTKVWRVKYKRNAHQDNPPGEQGLPEVSEDLYDLVIDNIDLTVLEKNDIFINFFLEKGVLSRVGVAKSN